MNRLRAGGSSFPVSLPPGFSSNGNFDTPPTFGAFYTQGLKGEVDFYRGLSTHDQTTLRSAVSELSTAITAGGGGTTAASLANGVYYTYSTASGEISNPIVDNAVHLNPAVCDSLQTGDLRASKIVRNVGPYSGSTVKTSCNEAGAVPSSDNLTRPAPVLRTAELVLLRAQAEIELGDFAAATSDINLVRTNEGGLAPLATLTSRDAAVSAVLYEKRYSLLFEGPTRLLDLRSYGRLNSQYLKKETAADIFQSVLPIPQSESNARGGNIACQA